MGGEAALLLAAAVWRCPWARASAARSSLFSLRNWGDQLAVIVGVDRVRVNAVKRPPILAVQERDPRQRIASLDIPSAQQAAVEEDTSRVRRKVAFELLGDELRVDTTVGPRLDQNSSLNHPPSSTIASATCRRGCGGGSVGGK